jgi:hypothetical protein
MRCPKCDALASDSDPCCLWCGKRLNHSRSAPTIPTAGPYGGGPPGARGRVVDGVGAVLVALGMLVGSAVASGAGISELKPAIPAFIAAGVCIGVPLLCVWVTVRLFGRGR